MKKNEATYLFGVSIFSVKRYLRAWSIPSSTQGKHDRRIQMTKVVLLYRADLSHSVKTYPWCIRIQGLPKPLLELELLLISEHQFASGATLELEHEFGFLTVKLLLDLGGHPIEAIGDLLLVSAREPDARALLDLRLYDDGAVGHAHSRHASNDELLIFHVTRSSETERKRYDVTEPVAIVG